MGFNSAFKGLSSPVEEWPVSQIYFVITLYFQM